MTLRNFIVASGTLLLAVMGSAVLWLKTFGLSARTTPSTTETASRAVSGTLQYRPRPVTSETPCAPRPRCWTQRGFASSASTGVNTPGTVFPKLGCCVSQPIYLDRDSAP
jgi:hypothetical protein